MLVTKASTLYLKNLYLQEFKYVVVFLPTEGGISATSTNDKRAASIPWYCSIYLCKFHCWHILDNVIRTYIRVRQVAPPTWYGKPEIRRIVGCLKEVVKRAAVEISRYEHVDVISALLRRMRSSKFTGVARRTRRDVIGGRDSPARDVTSGDSPRRRAVVERALELRRLDDVDVT